MQFSGSVTMGSAGVQILRWEAWILKRNHSFHTGASYLAGRPCTPVFAIFDDDNRLRPQHHGVFGPEVDVGDVLVVKQLLFMFRLEPQTMERVVAATNCVHATLGATFRPGFMVIMDTVRDEGIPQPLGNFAPLATCDHADQMHHWT